MYENGKITNVWLADVGSEVVIDAAAGANSVVVDDSLDFNLTGGQLRLLSDSITADVAYTSVDFTNNIIYLAGPTSSAFPSGTQVLVLPIGQQMKAMVDFDDGDEGIVAIVSSGIDTTLETGIRDEADQEAVMVSDDSGRWEVTNLDDELKAVDGSNIVNLPPSPEAVTDYVTEYAVGPDETSVPVSGWSTATPARTPGTYTWVRTVVTYGNGTTSTTAPALLTGNDGAPGAPGAPATLVNLTATTQTLVSPAAGGATTPATASITATPTGTTIPNDATGWQYSVDGGAFSGTVPTGVSRTGNVVTITGATMTAATIAVKATGASGATDTMTVAKVFQGAAGSAGTPGTPGSPGAAGADGYTILLSNEAHAFPGATANALAGSAASSVIAYKGATQIASTISAVSALPTGMTSAITGQGTTANVITFTVTTALTQANGVVDLTITADGKTFTKRFSWSIAFTGATGAGGAAGVSVTAITPYFARVAQTAAVPTQPTNQATPPAPWQLTEPAWTTNTFLYRTEKVSYSNGTYGYTTVVKVSADAAVGPSAVPASSPTPRVTGTTSSLIVETDEVAAGTMIEYHISTTDSFIPTLGGATKFTETEATVALIDKMPDGTPLDPAQQYYVRTFAYNVKGPAPTYSAQAPARLNLSNVDTLVTAKLVASFIKTGQISVGQFTLDAVGMKVNRPGGGYVFNFPFNGIDNMEITAAVTAVSLTVMNNLTINGSGNLNGILTAANGIVPPALQPGMSRTWPEINTFLYDGDDKAEWYHGLIQTPGSTTAVTTAMNFVGTTTIRGFHKTSGAWTGDVAVGSWKNTFAPLGGITSAVAGTPTAVQCYFVMGSDSSRAGKWYIYRIVASTGAKDLEIEVAADWAFFDGAYPRIFSDGTTIFLTYVNSNKALRLNCYNKDTLALGNTATIMTGLASRYNVGDAHIGNHDGIGNRVFIAMRGAMDVLCFNPVTPATPSTWTRDSQYDFNRPSTVAGLTYDTAAGQMMTLDTQAQLYYHGKYPANKSIQAKYAWLDANATGGTHETQPGPAKTYTLPARAYLSLSSDPPPDLDNQDSLNTDKANQVAMYASDDAGTIWRRILYTTSPWGSDHSTLAGLGSGTPKTVNEFLTSTVATPGRVKSFATDTLVGGVSSAAWEFDGSGKGKMGAYTTARHHASRTRASDQPTTSGTTAVLNFGSTVDPHVGISWDATNFWFVVSKAGLYICNVSVNWQNNGTGRRTLRIDKNGTAFAAKDDPGLNNLTQSLTVPIDLAVGDTVRSAVFQNSGAALNLLGADDTRSRFSLSFLGP